MTSREDCVINDLFNEPRRGSPDIISYEDLPYLARPIVEYMRFSQPAIAIAGDSGGRLFAFSIFRSWKKRFPGQPFPTDDQKIHFARVSSRNASERVVQQSVHHALGRAGIMDAKQIKNREILYIDDWAIHGNTFYRFKKAAASYGIDDHQITYATMCGNRIGFVHQVIGDSDRSPRNSTWNNCAYSSGVIYFDSEDGHPERPKKSVYSTAARHLILNHIDNYYELFEDSTQDTGEHITANAA